MFINHHFLINCWYHENVCKPLAFVNPHFLGRLGISNLRLYHCWWYSCFSSPQGDYDKAGVYYMASVKEISKPHEFVFPYYGQLLI